MTLQSHTNHRSNNHTRDRDTQCDARCGGPCGIAAAQAVGEGRTRAALQDRTALAGGDAKSTACSRSQRAATRGPRRAPVETAWRASEARVARCGRGQPRAAYHRAHLDEKTFMHPDFVLEAKHAKGTSHRPIALLLVLGCARPSQHAHHRRERGAGWAGVDGIGLARSSRQHTAVAVRVGRTFHWRGLASRPILRSARVRVRVARARSGASLGGGAAGGPRPLWQRYARLGPRGTRWARRRAGRV